eukprot:Pgem_evm1s10015
MRKSTEVTNNEKLVTMIKENSSSEIYITGATNEIEMGVDTSVTNIGTKKFMDSCIDGCGKAANFNYETENVGTHCKTCKRPGMVNLRLTCIGINCLKQPSFNYPDQKRGLYCGKCKLEGMINVKTIKCKCGVSSNYNYQGLKKAYCSNCKLDGMINVSVI